MLFEHFTRWLKKRQAPPSDTEPAVAPVPISSPGELKLESARPVIQSRNPRKELADECYQIGFAAAIDSGAPKPNPALLQTLEARAAAIAQTAHVPPSDAKDQRRVLRLKVLAETRERQSTDRDWAAVRHAAELKKLADVGPREPYPVFPKAFYYAAIIGLSISIAPTFQSLLLGLDSFLKWTAGGVCAVGVSLLIVHGILPSSRDENKQGDKQ